MIQLNNNISVLNKYIHRHMHITLITLPNKNWIYGLVMDINTKYEKFSGKKKQRRKRPNRLNEWIHLRRPVSFDPTANQ
jgi:hypothetical protein